MSSIANSCRSRPARTSSNHASKSGNIMTAHTRSSMAQAASGGRTRRTAWSTTQGMPPEIAGPSCQQPAAVSGPSRRPRAAVRWLCRPSLTTLARDVLSTDRSAPGNGRRQHRSDSTQIKNERPTPVLHKPDTLISYRQDRHSTAPKQFVQLSTPFSDPTSRSCRPHHPEAARPADFAPRRHQQFGFRLARPKWP